MFRYAPDERNAARGWRVLGCERGTRNHSDRQLGLHVTLSATGYSYSVYGLIRLSMA
jgi:hypothetical protein